MGIAGKGKCYCRLAVKFPGGLELAVARALSELSHHLLDAAARDIEQTSGVPAHPTL